jgi:hypothetical protein
MPPLTPIAAPLNSRWVPAPDAGTLGADRPQYGRVFGVSLNLGERVDWSWTLHSDGRRIVTGYQIQRRRLPLPRLRSRKRTRKSRSTAELISQPKP